MLSALFFAAPSMASSISGWSPSVIRVSGADRYATSVDAAKAAFPDKAGVVYVATGTNFPDALGAAAAAAASNGPLLLTSRTALSASVREEIQSLAPSEIKVVGGTAAVSSDVFATLSDLAPTVVRISGSDRYSTGRAIVQDAFSAGASTVYIATGANFPDALSASAAAGSAGDPVVLVNGSASALDPATIDLLQSLGATAFVIAGGPSAVSAGIADGLSTLGTVTRYYGADRYSTSDAINQAIFPSATSVYFATGAGFADALSGAVLASAEHSPLYIVEGNCVPDATETDLASAAVANVTLIGGPSALNSQVAALDNCTSVAPPPPPAPPAPPSQITGIVPGAFCPDVDHGLSGIGTNGKTYICGLKGPDANGHYHWNSIG
jgi:putative cell wall-binding protein